MKWLPIILLLAFSGCASMITTETYTRTGTSQLWSIHGIERDPRRLAMIEAELGSRNATSDGLFKYLGSRTSSAYGRKLYSRTGRHEASRDLKNCGDFPSSAQAQKFFLSEGGPVSDPHNLDGDGDGLACEWGRQLRRIVLKNTSRPSSYRSSSSRCYVGPRGGRYTITASGRKNYGGC
ncbi:hypothetical protein PhaeoP72_03183 [Phaeobacter inhibens]|uniref:excalibur calcium-binding domain-containing protein n=1 Tax=Phaeobacter inhibens TaxID=221822 RepID=UPI000CA10FFC|nr:hypothetical protein PhaeoP72_03183 [Phaeobacter inhibens]